MNSSFPLYDHQLSPSEHHADFLDVFRPPSHIPVDTRRSDHRAALHSSAGSCHLRREPKGESRGDQNAADVHWPPAWASGPQGSGESVNIARLVNPAVMSAKPMKSSHRASECQG